MGSVGCGGRGQASLEQPVQRRRVADPTPVGDLGDRQIGRLEERACQVDAARLDVPGRCRPQLFAEQPGESYVVEFLGSRDGLELNKAFARIKDPKVRRSIVDLARSLAGEEESQS